MGRLLRAALAARNSHKDKKPNVNCKLLYIPIKDWVWLWIMPRCKQGPVWLCNDLAGGMSTHALASSLPPSLSPADKPAARLHHFDLMNDNGHAMMDRDNGWKKLIPHRWPLLVGFWIGLCLPHTVGVKLSRELSEGWGQWPNQGTNPFVHMRLIIIPQC